MPKKKYTFIDFSLDAEVLLGQNKTKRQEK